MSLFFSRVATASVLWKHIPFIVTRNQRNLTAVKLAHKIYRKMERSPFFINFKHFV